MRHRRLVIFAVAGALVASAGPAAALVTSRHAAPTATTTAGPTSAPAVQPAPAASSTTAPPSAAGTPSTRSGTPVRISDPAKAADHLYQAWRAGDRQRALQFASAAAVDAMFAVPRSRTLRFSHCSFRLAGFDCIYAFVDPGESPDAVMRVEGGASAGWRVVSVFVLEQQRLSDPAKAADHLYRAWRAGDRQGALRFASATAVNAMFAVPRGIALTFSGCKYRDFGYDCRYTGDQVIIMRVNGGASAGYGVTAVTVRTA